MKQSKRLVAVILAALMMLSAVPAAAAAEAFQTVQTYTAGLFSDLGTDQWYQQSVEKAFELGLMSGDPNGSFRPAGQVTLAETVTVAARIHALATTGEETFVQGTPWYQVYVDYALQNGILTEEPADYAKAATRLEFARILAMALPAEDLPAINQVDFGAIPDVAYDEAVYTLYRAGILTGSDQLGTFLPDSTIQRSEVAAIVTRMALPELRQTVTLGPVNSLLRPVEPEAFEEEDEEEDDDRHESNRRPSRYEEDDVIVRDEVQAALPEASDVLDENNALTVPFDVAYPDLFASGDLDYSGDRILLKLEEAPSGRLSGALYEAGVVHLEELYSLPNAIWYKADVDGQVEEVMASVRAIDEVLVAEYDFAYAVEGFADTDSLSPDISCNPNSYSQWHLRRCGIHRIWGGDEEQELSANHGEGVVVAVIDTGVDYTHEDLKDNIWVNAKEIPGNGIDDDDNGYTDDYYGVNVIVNNGSATKPYSAGDPMDDHGHGTHVAGIIAGVNNNLGIVGIAYGAKIMAVKAGQSSGYFNSSDIAEAISYAYNNGADVINMSFGGSTVTMAVTEALEAAYTRCVLVASAGNDGYPNEPTNYYYPHLPNYPSALKYVLGVMSVDENGVESSFTNWDVKLYNTVEYEVYAPGENILSTIPGNKYASWDGTSMAAPIVSAMAALVRNAYPDLKSYPTKFIYGQIVNSGEDSAICFNTSLHGPHNLPRIVDIYNAITNIPTPDVGVTDYRIFDSTDLSPKNNGDGIIDAGETVALGFTVRNRWGMAKDTLVTVDAGNCQYVTITDYNGHQNADDSATINYGSVGTYSDSDCGKKMVGDVFVGWEQPFLLKIDKDCPNDYIIKLNIDVSCKNGLNEADKSDYNSPAELNVNIRRGVPLSGLIEKDTTLTADNYYIISNALQIDEGVTVRVEPGTQIQFWSDDPHDTYADEAIVYWDVRGTLLLEGTEDNPIQIFPGERMNQYEVNIYEIGNGEVKMWHTNIVNPNLSITYAEDCEFTQNYRSVQLYYRYLSSGQTRDSYHTVSTGINVAKNCAFFRYGGRYSINYNSHTSTPGFIYGRFEDCIFVDCDLNFATYNDAYYDSCVFYGNNTYLGEVKGDTSTISFNIPRSYVTELTDFATDPATGKTYLKLACYDSNNTPSLEHFAQALGGTLLCINSQEELEFLQERSLHKGTIGLKKDLSSGDLIWVDGTEADPELVEDFYFNSNSQLAFSDSGYVIVELPAQYVTDIELDSYEVTIDTETTWQINAKAGPSEMADAVLVYESMNPDVAEVTRKGKVIGVSNGDTVIRVYSPDKQLWRELTVHVVDRVLLESIDLGEDFRMNVDDERQLMPVLSPANTSQQRLYFESSDEEVVTVTETGTVTAVGVGHATVTVSSAHSNVYDTVAIEVGIPAKSVKAAESSIVLSLSAEYTVEDLGFTVKPAKTTYPELVWASSNPEILEVDEDGNVILKKQGHATVRGTHEETGLYDEVLVAVTELDPAVHVVQLQYTPLDSSHGHYYIALLDDGTLWYWGGSISRPTKLPFDSTELGIGKIVRFSYHCSSFSSGSHMLLLDDTGELNHYFSSLYIDDTPPVSTDYKLNNAFNNGQPLQNVITAFANTCKDASFYVLQKEGDEILAWSWGANSKGQLGDGSTASQSTMVQINIPDIVDIAADGEASGAACLYVLDKNGDVWLYGNDNTIPVLRASDVIDLQQSMENHAVIIDADYEAKPPYYIEDGTAYMYGYGNGNASGKAGVGVDGSYNGYKPVESLENVTEVFVGSGGYSQSNNNFFQTADGKFYGAGYNTHNELGNLTQASQSNVPTRIFFGVSNDENAPELESSNLDETISEHTLILDFDQALLNASGYGAIYLRDAFGQAKGIRKEIILDKLYITPISDLTDDMSYTLTIPAGALQNKFAVETDEELTFTFVFVAPEEEGGLPSISTPDIILPVTDGGLKYDDSVIREEWTAERVMAAWKAFDEAGYNTRFRNNAVLNRLIDDRVDMWLRFVAPSDSANTEIGLGGNYWGTTSEKLLFEQLLDFDHFQSLAKLNEGEYLTAVPEDVWPVVSRAGLLDSNHNETDIIGNETVTFFVEFNRDMDKSVPLDVRFGSYYPYADYQVDGDWVSKRRWEGTTTLTTIIENGYQYWTIMNGRSAADDEGEHLKLYEDWGRFSFQIDTTSAQAMILQGDATDTGIRLEWSQDDFSTLMGYNIYRADKDEDAYYQRLNSSIIPVGEETFFDDTVLPGQIYYYKFTVVQTDLSESKASGKIRILSKDTMAPGLYHTPIYHAYAGSNLVISAEIVDNLALHPSAELYYRIPGGDWKTAVMTALNDSYSAVIGFNDVTTAGIEYYIVADDGVNLTFSGSPAEPHVITVQQPLDRSSLGDVDNDGYVTLLDALIVLKAKNELLQLTPDEFTRADLNGDKRLTAAEALTILKYANGEIGSLQVES